MEVSSVLQTGLANATAGSSQHGHPSESVSQTRQVRQGADDAKAVSAARAAGAEGDQTPQAMEGHLAVQASDEAISSVHTLKTEVAGGVKLAVGNGLKKITASVVWSDEAKEAI